MPRANGPTNNIKEGPIDVNADVVDEVLQYEDEEEVILGGGAHDGPNEANRHGDRTEDREKDGTKVPDAMGAGQ
jgi:hypothetical protein